MTKQSANTFLNLVKQLGDTLLEFLAHLMRWLPEASWPQILVLCVVLALISAVLPLAATLFVLFLIMKFILLAAAQSNRREPLQNFDCEKNHEGGK